MQDNMKSINETSLTSLSDQDKLLQEANRRKVIEHIPLIVVLFIITVIGIIGNILTISFYGFRAKRTPTFTLIKLLAIVDLIVCFLCFTTIADLCVNIKFTSAVLCKLMYFLDHWSMQSSVLILWIISIHRYRRLCKPVGRQLTVKSATIAVILLSGFSMIYCTNIFITYNPVKVNISTSDASIPIVIGHYCTNTDEPNLNGVLLTFHISDVVLVIFCFITFVFTYGNIWRTVRKHNRKTAAIHNVPSKHPRQKLADVRLDSKTPISNASSKDNLSAEQATIFQSHIDSTTVETEIFSTKQSGSSDQTLAKIGKVTAVKSFRKVQTPSKSATVTRERNITAVMFAVTVGLVICFTPYFIASVGIRAMSATTEEELNTGMELALRFPFFNSVINPIIFCVLNSQYRRYIKEKLTLCLNTESH
ncbi:cholecystokinin receptor type A-like [Mercenaria mercenaria]|uniref:cholecystokinin receptor type A-like n=1 Tax=Mercenaria mercenaria TaxID=6596 RepID=UPI00234F0650|nr:cholecystokinin receptor type A-like [Mercenaria mercenaria]